MSQDILVSKFAQLFNIYTYPRVQTISFKSMKNPTFHVNAYLDINPLQATWKCQDVDEVEQLSEIFRMFSEC